MENDILDIDWVLSEIKSMMDEMGLNVSVAESLTAGRVQDLFAKQSGASSYFEGGLTAYNIRQKVMLLGVEHLHAKEVNCVSQLVADEMAKGVANKFVSDYGISTTGYAESYYQEGETRNSEAYISIYNLKDGVVEQVYLGGIAGDRDRVRGGVAEAVVRYFYLTLLKKKKEFDK